MNGNILQRFVLGASLAALPAIGDEPPVIPQLSTARDELINRWDLNKDGRIDDSEAEVARSQMRQKRVELLEKSQPHKGGASPGAAGPLKRPEVPPGREPSATAPRAVDPLGRAFAPKASASPAQIPKTSDEEDSKKEESPDKAAPRPLNAGGLREMPITTGGSRAGAPAVRPGYGASGPKVDLNAGRLPGGLPPGQGLKPGVGSMPFRKPAASPLASPSRPQPSGAPRGPFPQAAPRVSAEDIGSP